jgi:predicted enzyme related to lactoylglutathione lyase
MASKPATGTFCWNELMTRDAAAAKAFYGALFGWKMSEMSMAEGVYTLLRSAGKDAGGLMQIRPDMGEMPSHWLAYVMVDNVDAATKRAGELGARVHVPGMDIPGIGRFGIFEDPTGAQLAVFQPAPKAKPRAKSSGRVKPVTRKTKAKTPRRRRR